MKWINDKTSRFPKRPYFEEGEIDEVCENALHEFFMKKHRMPFHPPLSTDDLTVLIEKETDNLDLYADLATTEGPTVEGVTEFRPDMKPIIKIDQKLSANPNLANRLRSTLAHEFFHAKYHREIWEQVWSSKPHLIKAKSAICFRGTVHGNNDTDWLEWQAGYGSGALLMPISSIVKDFDKIAGEAIHLVVGNPKETAFVSLVSNRYQVSKEAARMRLLKFVELYDRSKLYV